MIRTVVLRNMNILTVVTFVFFLPEMEASKGISVRAQLRNKIAMK